MLLDFRVFKLTPSRVKPIYLERIGHHYHLHNCRQEFYTMDQYHRIFLPNSIEMLHQSFPHTFTKLFFLHSLIPTWPGINRSEKWWSKNPECGNELENNLNDTDTYWARRMFWKIWLHGIEGIGSNRRKSIRQINQTSKKHERVEKLYINRRRSLLTFTSPTFQDIHQWPQYDQTDIQSKMENARRL